MHFKFLILYFFLIAKLGAESIHPEHEKAIICGIIKNGGHCFEFSKQEILKIGKLFKDFKIVIYENNSTDNTKELYQRWASTEPRLIFLNENWSDNFQNHYTPRFGDFRTELIAYARNQVMKFIEAHVEEDYRFVFMMDLDEFEPIDTDQIVKCFKHPIQEWDALFSFGIYDIFALVHPEFKERPEIIGWEDFDKIAHNIKKKFSNMIENEKWLKVDSGYGGLAIYKRDSIKGCFYSGKINHSFIDLLQKYQIFESDYYKSKSNRYIASRRYLMDYFSKIAKHNLYNSNTKFNYYSCEHINFHLKMKENGFDNLFIVFDLKRHSKDHNNCD